MQPNNSIIGDSYGTDLPEIAVDDTAKKELANKAKYSRSKEYKELKAKADARIEFYQRYLPNGQPIAVASKQERAEQWGFANLLIAEFNQLFDEHETAEQLFKDEFGG